MGDANGNKYEKIEAPVETGKQEPVKPVEPSKPSGEITHGIDISRYQPRVNFSRAWDLGYRFCVAKATDGEASTDPMFESHMKGSASVGMVRGAYCFNRFSSNPKKQAEHFVRVAGNADFLVGDIEWDKSKTTEAKFGKRYGEGKIMDAPAADHAFTFMAEVERLSGKTPLLYSNTYFFLGFPEPERFLRFPYWASNYAQKALHQSKIDVSKVRLPKPYKKAAMWQWSDKSVNAKAIVGEEGLDVNVFFGSVDELRKMAQ
jgi:lysozyme